MDRSLFLLGGYHPGVDLDCFKTRLATCILFAHDIYDIAPELWVGLSGRSR
jgi:hypothetical protein